MASEFWLGDVQFERLRPLLPDKLRGVPHVDRLMIDATHLKAHRTAASLLKAIGCSPTYRTPRAG